MSTRILYQFASRTTLARDWRVVCIPEEDRGIDVATLFSRIADHIYDPLEPFSPSATIRNAAIRGEVGSSQEGNFQGFPLTVLVGDLVQAFGSYIKFFILCEEVPSTSSQQSSKNAFEVARCIAWSIKCELNNLIQVLMSAAKARYLPSPPSDKAMEKSKKMVLKKDVIDWLHAKDVGWSSDVADSTGADFVTALSEALWYVDGHFDTLRARACPVPSDFEQFSGYNQPERSKHRRRIADNLSSAVLDSHSAILNKLAMYPWFNSASWKPVREVVCALADSLFKYAKYLQEKNLEVQDNHGKLTPVRSNSEAESYTFIKKAVWVKPDIISEFRALQKQLDDAEELEPIFVNDFSPANQR